MKQFVMKIGLLLICIIGSIVIINGLFLHYMSPQYLYGFDASIIDKIDRAKSISEPKIILVGNSNLAFGVNSCLIEQEFEMPVVNMGLHGSLGNEFHENMAKDSINVGDIVIVCHNNFDEYDGTVDPVLVWTTIENHFNLWKLVPLRDYWRMFVAFPTYMNKVYALYEEGAGNQKGTGAYTREAFNEYGDNAWPRPDDNMNDYSKDERVSKVSATFVKRCNRLYEYCNKRGALLVVAGFPICQGEHTPDLEEYKQLQQILEERLECPIISNFEDYIMDYHYFYDGTPHLNDEGTLIRTQLLIDDLRRWME